MRLRVVRIYCFRLQEESLWALELVLQPVSQTSGE